MKPQVPKGQELFTVTDTPIDTTRLARRVGIRVVISHYGGTGNLWMFVDLDTGWDIGSWVESTGAYRIAAPSMEKSGLVGKSHDPVAVLWLCAKNKPVRVT